MSTYNIYFLEEMEKRNYLQNFGGRKAPNLFMDSLEIPKSVAGKQCRPGSPLFANSSTIFL